MSKKKPPHNQEIDPSDRELFLNAFYQGELPLANPQLDIPNSDRELFLAAVNNSSWLAVDAPKSPPRPKKARPRNTIDATIDLHGCFAEEAINRLLRFIRREQDRGSRTILVIHGKGSGILKNAVLAVIESHGSVDDFQVAPGKYGGHGAVILRINRQS